MYHVFNAARLVSPLFPGEQLTLMVAKWVGDCFNMGIYDIHIHLRKVPLLEWEAEEEMKRFVVDDIMSTNIKQLNRVNRISDIVHLLTTTTHNGFPVVDEFDEEVPGRFVGLILRSQLITLLQNQTWGKKMGQTTSQPLLPHMEFVARYPQRTPIESIALPTAMASQSTYLVRRLFLELQGTECLAPLMLTQVAHVGLCFICLSNRTLPPT